jgi:hypothetical protein
VPARNLQAPVELGVIESKMCNQVADRDHLRFHLLAFPK